ncbi:hypothetical protein [Citricoccus muralis]|uniref:Uncharacterized protein n=1 Tax=Citricoccus muralis TaxID=169134 RepID=A0A3D9L7G0_9MICC|nr:hypothetical protein [Citricoccus muralis]REE02278.1 hypothetical protein C8E99_0044 [Citricoccus muralis]
MTGSAWAADRIPTLIGGSRLNTDWWARKLGDLPGGPVLNDDGTHCKGRISRGGIFTLAEDAVQDTTGEAALRLLWHALHWGTGDSNRGNRKRIASIAADPPRFGRLLHDAAAAFTFLKPGRTNAIKDLGPGFFTKFLFFAGGGHPDHPCLIADRRVQRTLHRETGKQHRRVAPNFLYGVNSYTSAVAVMRQWATEVSTPERAVAPDEVERWAFASGTQS